MPSRESGATIGELIGLKIQPMTGALNKNRAIETTGGDHYFHDDATFGRDVKVTRKFGCNGREPQWEYPSGGALATYSGGPYGYSSPNMAQDLYNAVERFQECLINCGLMSR